MKINLPNFFILGAGKCGTTTLHAGLRQHPQIFLTTPKEPTFFCRQYQIVKNPVDYFALYQAVTHETIRGEASHVYLTDPESAPLLAGLFPEAKFMIILRHPTDRAYSLYHHNRRSGTEMLRTFELALAAEDSRSKSDHFPQYSTQYLYNFLYFRSGCFAEQIERYFALFDHRQFHFLTLDEVKNDPENTMQRIGNFLDLPVDPESKFTPTNEGVTTPYSATLEKWWQRLEKFCKGPLQNPIRLGLNAFNSRPLPPIAPKTAAALDERFAPSLNRLHELTGITLTRKT
jgi:hypothetical protein